MVTLTVRSEATIVLSEGFENGIPATWTQDTVTPNASLVYGWLTEPASTATNPTGVAEGTTRVYMRNSTSRTKACVTRLITPVMDCAIYQPRLIFAHAQAAKSSGAYDQLKIYYRSTPTAEWTLMTEFTERMDGWRYDTLDLIGPTNTYQLAFEGNCASGYGIVIDDITIKATSQCTDIQGLGVVPMSYSAELTIGDLSAESFQVVVTTAPVTDWTSFDPSTAVYYNPNYPDVVLTITGLQPQTDYYAYVRSYCSDNETGFTNWVSATFRTSIGFPFAESFDGLSALPEGWDRMVGTPNEAYAGAAPRAYNGGWKFTSNATVTGSAHISDYAQTSTTNGAYWILMPSIDLTTVDVDTMIDLKFKLALTTTESGTTNVTTKTGLSFYVMISEDAGLTWAAANTTTWSAYADADFDINGVTATPTRYRVNLNAYKGKVIRVAFVSMSVSGTGYFHVDDVALASYDAQCGDVARVKLNAGSNSIVANWTIYGKQNATIQLSEDVDFATLLDSAVITTGTTYTFTNLQESTNYYVRVKQDCEDAGWAMASCRTAAAIPYLNPFVSTTFPADWTRYSGLTAQDVLAGTATFAAPVTTGWTVTSNSTNFPGMGYRAYMYLSGTNKYWMVSPAISMADNSTDPLRLSFLVALAKSSSSATAPAFDEDDVDDVFAVLISRDGGETWLPADASIWDTDTLSTNPKISDFTQVPSRVNIDMTAYRGEMVRIAIYGGSGASGSSNYLMVGNLSVNTFDANCGGVTNLNRTFTLNDVTATWNTVGYPEVNVQLSTSATFATLVDSAAVNNGTVTFSNLIGKTTYYLRVRQQCSVDDADWKVTSFTTPIGVPMIETFDEMTTGYPANGWVGYRGMAYTQSVDVSTLTVGTSTYGWYVAAPGNIVTGMEGKTMRINIDGSSYNAFLTSPLIDMTVPQGSGVRAMFKMARTTYGGAHVGDATDHGMAVYVSTDGGTNYDRIYDITSDGTGDENTINDIDENAQWRQVDLTPYVGQSISIAFFGHSSEAAPDSYFYIDSLSFVLIDANCTGSVKLSAADVTATSATINWTVGGANSLDIVVATDTAYANVVYSGTITDVLQLTTLTPNTRYYVKGHQTCYPEDKWTYMQFKTLCQAQTPEELGVMTFDESSSLDCWTLGFMIPGSSSSNAAAAWGHGDTYGYGILLAKQAANSGETTYSDGAFAISPELNLGTDSINKYQVTFNAFTYSRAENNVARLNVGIVTSPGQLDTYERIKTIPLEYAADSTQENTYVVSFADYMGDYNEEYGRYIMFMSEAGDSMTNYVFIDNVVIEPATSCQMLIETAIDSIEVDHVRFSWENSGATRYEVMVTPYGGQADTVQTTSIIFQTTVTTTYATITGLSGNTRYYAYVRGVCEEDGVTLYSRWSGARYFKSGCDRIAAYPWSEGFEDYEGSAYNDQSGNAPDCWITYTTGSYVPHVLGPSSTTSYYYVNNGDKALILNGIGENYTVLPRFNTDISNLEMSFYMRTYSATIGTLTLGYITDDAISPDSTFVGIQTFEGHTGDFILREADLVAVPANASRLAFRWSSTSSYVYYYCIIDDITVSLAPACHRPSITSSVADLTSIDLTWVGNAATYEVQCSMDQTFASATTQTVSGSTQTISGLVPGTTYFFRVRGLCGEDGDSEWSQTYLSRTAYGVPFIENFGGTTVPDSWSFLNGSPEDAFAGTNPTPYTPSGSYDWQMSTSSNGLPANHLRINIFSSTTNHWIVSPTIDCSNVQPTDSVVFSFDFAYTNYASASVPDDGADQSLWLLVSTDGGNTWPYANSYVWTHTDTAAVTYSLDSIPVTGRHIELNFARFAQQSSLRFAFAAVSHATDNDFHLANVQLVKIVENCDAPTLNTAIADAYSVALTWDGDSAKATIIQISRTGDFTSGNIYDTIPAGLSTQVSGLNPSLTYYARIKQVCSPTDETVYSSVLSFNTLCVPVTEFPWMESFENTSTTDYVLPICWDRVTYSSGTITYPRVYASTTYAQTGKNVMYMSGGLSSSAQAAILPELGVNPQTLELSFYYRCASTTDAYAPVVVGTMRDLGDASTFVTLDTLPKLSTMTLYRRFLNDADSTARYIVISLAGGTSSQTVYIDDVKLDLLPACPDILNVSVSIGSTEATVAVPNGDAANYEYILTDDAIVMETLDSVAMTHILLDTIGGAAMTFTGLQPATTYYVYVRALCSATEMSNWTPVRSFTTDCLPITTMPWNEGFESHPAGQYNTVMEPPVCWNVMNDGSSSVTPHVYGSGSYLYVHNGSKAMYFYGSGNNYAALPIFEAPINTLRMSFWMQTESATYGTLTLGYITAEDADFNTFTPIATFANSQTMVQRSVDLADVPATAYRLVFRWYYSSWYGLGIDDIQITARPSNETILGVQTSNVTRTSMDITWTPRQDSSVCANYELVISETALNNNALDSATSIMLDTAYYHASMLDRDTRYYIYVRTVCDSVYGVWATTNVKTLPIGGCETVVVLADGTTTSNYIPFYGLFLDDYNHSQSIYPASMLTGLVGKRIGSLKYFLSSGETSDEDEYSAIHVRVGVTNATTVPNGFLTDPKVEVFHDVVTASTTDGMTITFNQPVLYTGGNIFIEFESPDEDMDYKSMAFYGMTATTGSSRYQYGTNAEVSSTFLPKVQVTTVCAPSDLVACPTVEEITSELQGDGTSEAIIRWTASEADYANGYDLFITDNDSIVPDTTTVPQYTNLTDTFVTVNGLTAYTVYHVFVRVHCNAGGHDDGDSEWTPYTFMTLSTCPVVNNLTSVLTGKTTAEAMWDPAYAGQTPDYRYILSTVELTDADLITAQPLTNTTGHLYLTDLTPDQQYWLYVASSCGDEMSPYLVTTFTTPANCAPVENLTITTIKHNMVVFSWERSQFGTETLWEVGIEGDSTNVMQTADTTAVLFGLNAETNYTLYVKAMCDESETSRKATMAFTTAPAPLPCIETGDGTASGNYSPFYNLYKNAWTQTIYTPEQVGRSGQIQAIQLHVAAVPTTQYVDDEVTIYLAHTSMEIAATTSDWIPQGDLVRVYAEAPFAHAADTGWFELQLQVPFYYNGTDNLAIVIGRKNSTAYSSALKFYYTARTSGALLYRGSDSYATYGEYPNGVTGTMSTNQANVMFCFPSESCAQPTGMTVSDITYSSARVMWTPGGTERNWETYLSTTQLTDAELDSVAATAVATPMVALSNLIDDVDYWFYARSICDSTTHSSWAVVHFVTPAMCLAPASVTADSTTTNMAWLTIVDVNAGFENPSYEVAYGPAISFSLKNAATYQTAQANDTNLVLTNLQHTTTYAMAVRVTCDATHTSRWSPISYFQTDCGVITTLPWGDDFNSLTSGIPHCWDNSLGTTTSESYRWNYYSAGMSGACVRFNSYNNSNGKTNILMTPEFHLDTVAELTFNYKNPTGGDYSVGVTTDNGQTITTELTGLVGIADWSLAIVDLSAYVNQTIRICFIGTSNYGNGDAYLYLDNVVLDLPGPCARPTHVTAMPGNGSVRLSWTGNVNNTYVVERADDLAFSGEIDSTTVANDTTVVITGLQENSTYYFRVRAFCGEDGESPLSTPVKVQIGRSLPFAPDYDNMTAFPADWTRSSTTASAAFSGTPLNTASDKWYYAAANTVINNGHFKLNIYGDDCHYWLLTPVLNITSNTGADVMLNFDVALMKWGSSSIGVAPTETGTDDIFMVAISEDGGQTWSRQNALVWQDAPGADYSYSAIPADHVASYHIDLSQYMGKAIQIGFYGESTVTGGDNDLHLANVRVAETLITSFTDTICEGTSYAENGFNITPNDYELGENDFDIYTPGTSTMPDQYASLDLTVLPITRDTIDATVCEGAAFYVDENVYLEEGEVVVGEQTIIFTLTSPNGCDSIIYLNVTGLPAARATESASTCSGIPYNWHGQDYYLGGTYVDTLQTILGCDSICTLLLTVEDVIHTDTAITLCYGEQIIINGQTITTSGIYTETIDNPEGCDEEIAWHVTAIGKLESHKRVVACKGTTYSDDLIQGLTQEYHGSTTTTSKVSGCDSTVIYDIWFAEAGETIYVNVPENELPFYVNGLEIVAAGTPQGEYTRTVATSCGDVIMVVNVGEPIIRYTVTVKAENGLPYGSGVYVAGEQVEIGVNPFNGYKFEKWNDGNTDNPRTITVNADVTYTGTCVVIEDALEDVLRDMDEDDVLKLIENQQLIIIRNGVRYNAQGAVIE